MDSTTASDFPKATSGKPGGLLGGLRVLELGEQLAVPVLGLVLVEQGAEVVRVIDTARPAQDPVLAAVLACGKREASLDLGTPEGRGMLARLAASADVVLCDRGAVELAELGLDWEALRAGPNPGLVSCSIPAFAAGDPRAGLPVHDALAGAAGCLYERMLGAPRFHDLPIPSVLAALFAGSGVVGALVARLRTGRGQHVESTLFGSALFAQILGVFMKTGVPRGFVPLKLVATPFMRAWRCKDGRYAYLHITLPAHNARMLDVLDQQGLGQHARALRGVLSADTVRDPSQVGSIGEAKRIIQVLQRIFLERTADEWEASLGQELCCIKVRTIDEWLTDSLEAGMSDAAKVDDPVFGPLLTAGPGVVCPERPAVVGPRAPVADLEALVAAWQAAPKPVAVVPAAGIPADPKHPLEGLRVADLSRIIAGPCAARILAELGAEVTSIQSPGALDWQLSFHLLFNPGKRSVTLDQQSNEGKATLRALFDDLKPDVVLQNYRHLDVARSIGVGPEALRERFPGLVYAHLNAYGDVGRWQERPGFEQVVQAVSGIQVSYGTNGVPRLLPTPVIDIGSGLAGALAAMLGLYHRERTGQGVFVTTHLTWVAVLLQVLKVADVQRAAVLEQARVRGHSVTAPDPRHARLAGLLRTRDGWVAAMGPREEILTWLHAEQARFDPEAPNPLPAALKAFRWKRLNDLRHRLYKMGLSDDIVLEPVQPASKVVEALAELDLGPIPPVQRRPYAGCPKPLAFIASPIRLSRTPAVYVEPPTLRGAATREVLARLGHDLPEGAGTLPYPADKPLLIWLVGLIRWGLFAWRTGSI